MKLFAHRGSSAICPENTMAAFRQAEREGADGIELDVQWSKDRQLVIIHDRTVDRTTNGSGAVKDLTWDELKRLDAGSWYNEACANETIPTLQEVLQWAQSNDLLLNIELKTDEEPYVGIEKDVLSLVDRFELRERVILSSFNLETLGRVREIDRTIDLAVLIWEDETDMVSHAQRLDATALHTQAFFLNTEEAMRAKEAGLAVRLYTINELEQLRGVSLENVESIMTDEPKLLRRKLESELFYSQ